MNIDVLHHSHLQAPTCCSEAEVERSHTSRQVHPWSAVIGCAHRTLQCW